MTTTIIILAKLIFSSALLYAFYWLVLRNRATYTLARLYLLLIPFVSLTMSGLTLKVLPQSAQLVETTLTPGGSLSQTTTSSPSQGVNAPMPYAAEPASVPTAPSSPSLEGLGETLGFESQWSPSLFVILLLAFVSLVLLASALYHIAYLHWLGRRMKKLTTAEGYTLVYSSKVPAPCSFGKTIFMPTNITDGQLDPILRHEKAHIRHGHFVDVWMMELTTRLMWFNPILWLVRKELGNVHEFEADHDVLGSGVDINAYQTLLLQQVMADESAIANGFNHSFIRRRFVEMKHSTAGTLGRIGKAAMCLWVTLLFCGFTFAQKDVTDPATRPLGIVELAEPQVFTIECEVDRLVADKQFNIFLSDDYLQIQGEKPVATIPVVDGKFRYQIPLKKMTAGRICGTRPGAKGIDLFFVPGETVELHSIANDQFIFEPTMNYVRKIDRGVFALRNATGWKSPHLPKLKGKRWEQVSCMSMGISELMVKEVFFGKEETVLRIAPTEYFFCDMSVMKESFLTDGKGGKYQLKRAVLGELGENCSTDIRTFGGYYAFEPVPYDVEELNFLSASTVNDTVVIDGPGIFHIRKAPKAVAHQPNFQVDIAVSQGISDCGYLISMYDDKMCRRSQIADIPVVNKHASFATYVDEPRLVDLTATFPDGSICTHCVRFPFVPGEHAEVKVMNGSFFLSGSKFYKEWSDADELEENARKYHKEEETQALLLDYLQKHATEEGCVMRYFQYEILPRETILKIIPDSMKNGRFKKFLKEKNA